jgi:hypothetical protein
MTVIPIRTEYEARQFEVHGFKISGTLCGHIDFAVPNGKTYVLSPDEMADLIAAMQAARHDVLENSRPSSDARLYDAQVRS